MTAQPPEGTARARLAADRTRRTARQHRRRQLVRAGAAAGLVAALVGLGLAWQLTRTTSEGEPAVAIPIGAANAPVVHVYEDFQCAACRQFERRNSQMLQTLARQGQARVVYHPVSIFSDAAEDRSLRAANAALAAAQTNKTKFLAYHDLLFTKQPPEAKPASAADTSPLENKTVPVGQLRGFETWKLGRYAQQVGLDSHQITQHVESGRHTDRITNYTRELIKAGKITGTPTLYIGDTKISHQSGLYANPQALKNKILSAGKK